MMRSLFNAVSGLKVHQTKMDVVSNNVANVNTVGFKADRVTFKDAFYQRVQGASAHNNETGRAGTNPLQIGLGVGIGSIDHIMTQGIAQRTDRSLDVMIQGDGMLIVSDTTGTYFTRAGNIDIDAKMNLHINGMKLMGWDIIKENGEYVIDTGTIGELNIGGEKQFMEPEATTLIDMIGNLNPAGLINNQTTSSMTFLDTEGYSHTVDVVFTYHGEQGGANGDPIHGFWTYEFITAFDTQSGSTRQYAVQSYPDNNRENAKRIGIHVGDTRNMGSFSNNMIQPGNLLSEFVPKGLLVFNTDGRLVAAETLRDDLVNGGAAAMRQALNGSGMITRSLNFNQAKISEIVGADIVTGMTIMLAPADSLDPPATFGKETAAGFTVDYKLDYTNGEDVKQVGQIDLDLTRLTQWQDDTVNAKFIKKDGNTYGELRDISVGSDGKITGRYDNGGTRLLGQIPVAQFQNSSGLEKIGDNLFTATINSGHYVVQEGKIVGGALEMSNVELSEEFTEMIVTQRGFQANSRIISTSDEMLEELVRLKR